MVVYIFFHLSLLLFVNHSISLLNVSLDWRRRLAVAETETASSDEETHAKFMHFFLIFDSSNILSSILFLSMREVLCLASACAIINHCEF